MPEYKPLYNEYNALNTAGRNLGEEVEKAVKPIMRAYEALGYNPREIDDVIINLVLGIGAEMILSAAVKAHKAKIAEKTKDV